jgi:hypothetical protein
VKYKLGAFVLFDELHWDYQSLRRKLNQAKVIRSTQHRCLLIGKQTSTFPFTNFIGPKTL